MLNICLLSLGKSPSLIPMLQRPQFKILKIKSILESVFYYYYLTNIKRYHDKLPHYYWNLPLILN